MDKDKSKILLVEDEPNFGDVLKNYLELNSFEVELCRTAELGLNSFINNHYELCILDVMMPGMNGFDLAQHLRKRNPEIPFIFLTARNLKEDIVKGFEIGADDYLTKPFDTELLIYKIKAILNRKAGEAKVDITQHEIGDIHFNYKLRTLTSSDFQKKLSPKESHLLKMLCESKNDVMPRKKALLEIWKDDNYFTTRSMDVYIAKLRKYLKADPAVKIENLHGEGYRLLCP